MKTQLDMSMFDVISSTLWRFRGCRGVTNVAPTALSNKSQEEKGFNMFQHVSAEVSELLHDHIIWSIYNMISTSNMCGFQVPKALIQHNRRTKNCTNDRHDPTQSSTHLLALLLRQIMSLERLELWAFETEFCNVDICRFICACSNRHETLQYRSCMLSLSTNVVFPEWKDQVNSVTLSKGPVVMMYTAVYCCITLYNAHRWQIWWSTLLKSGDVGINLSTECRSSIGPCGAGWQGYDKVMVHWFMVGALCVCWCLLSIIVSVQSGPAWCLAQNVPLVRGEERMAEGIVSDRQGWWSEGPWDAFKNL